MLRSLLMRPVIEQLRRLAMTPALVNPVGQSAAGPPGVGVGVGVGLGVGEGVGVGTTITPSPGEAPSSAPHPASASRAQPPSRSEERRVGKECVRTGRYRWSPDHQNKKKQR